MHNVHTVFSFMCDSETAWEVDKAPFTKHLKVDWRGKDYFFFNPKDLRLPGKHFLLRSFSHLDSFFLCSAFAVINYIMFLMESSHKPACFMFL